MDFLETYIYDTKNDTDDSLRFLTHLLVFLDSLSQSTTPITLDIPADSKDNVLLKYLEHLASREDLWCYLALYASLLPNDLMLKRLPSLLHQIESDEERAQIVTQLERYFPDYGLDLIILKKVVDIVLSSDDDEFTTETDGPSVWDHRKMRSILWLTHREEHLPDALIEANKLLRQFLIADKDSSAYVFVQDVLPKDLLDKVLEDREAESGNADGDAAMSDLVVDTLVERARAEHGAYTAYLQGMKDVFDWREALTSTDASTRDMAAAYDRTALNTREAAVATKMELREFVKEKQKSSQYIVTAAGRAVQSLRAVLEHPGGWLFTEGDGADLDQEETRQNELKFIRQKLLPKVTLNYHEVCVETAAWMATSLDDAEHRLDGTWSSALNDLAPTVDLADCPFAPSFWTQQAMEVSELVVSGTYKVKEACDTAELKSLLNKLSETAVTHLLYLEPFEHTRA